MGMDSGGVDGSFYLLLPRRDVRYEASTATFFVHPVLAAGCTAVVLSMHRIFAAPTIPRGDAGTHVENQHVRTGRN